jgi:transcriptional regulator with XRE-family HTH domain
MPEPSCFHICYDMTMRDRPDTASISDLDPGALVRELRRLAGLSQAELARRIGSTQAVVSRWERREEGPRLDALVRVLRATGFEADLVFRRRDDEDRSQIRWLLGMTPDERARHFRGAVRAYADARRARRVPVDA